MLHEFEIGYDGHDRPLPKKPQGDKPDLWIPDPEETKCPGEQEKESDDEDDGRSKFGLNYATLARGATLAREAIGSMSKVGFKTPKAP